jgi:hypothetical protein
LDSNSSLLETDLLLKTLPEPRNLTVKEQLIVEISRRGSDESEKCDVNWETTIGELARQSEEKFANSQFSNQSGIVLLTESKVRDANWHLFVVSKTAVKSIEIELPDGNSRSFEIDSETLIGAFLSESASWVGVSPDRCILSDDGGVLGAEVSLGNVRGKLHLALSDNSSQATELQNNEEEEEERIGNNPDETSYLFQNQNVEFRVQIPADWTVFQVKELIAIRFHTIADYVSLVFYGRNLKDELLFSREVIQNEAIMVYVRTLETGLLKTLGYENRSEVEKPVDFLQRVNRLKQSCHLDSRTCSRSLIFYDYDMVSALRALKKSDPE